MTLQQISGPVILEIPADPASLFLVRCLVDRLSQRLEFSREVIDRIILAVDEACTNVIRHAYGNRTNERIVLTFEALDDRLQIEIRDFGPYRDPSTFPHRNLEILCPGGLGTHFIRAAMDQVDYGSPDDGRGGMRLRLVKFRAPKTGD